ncbi:hypothetical protein U1Q18_046581 [Sarracenia purpurea var. burkii]
MKSRINVNGHNATGTIAMDIVPDHEIQMTASRASPSTSNNASATLAKKREEEEAHQKPRKLAREDSKYTDDYSNTNRRHGLAASMLAAAVFRLHSGCFLILLSLKDCILAVFSFA